MVWAVNDDGLLLPAHSLDANCMLAVPKVLLSPILLLLHLPSRVYRSVNKPPFLDIVREPSAVFTSSKPKATHVLRSSAPGSLQMNLSLILSWSLHEIVVILSLTVLHVQM